MAGRRHAGGEALLNYPPPDPDPPALSRQRPDEALTAAAGPALHCFDSSLFFKKKKTFLMQNKALRHNMRRCDYVRSSKLTSKSLKINIFIYIHIDNNFLYLFYFLELQV